MDDDETIEHFYENNINDPLFVYKEFPIHKINYINIQSECITAFILFLEKKINIKINENIINEIKLLYNLSIKYYMTINNFKKIKEKQSFCYLSCWYIFKKMFLQERNNEDNWDFYLKLLYYLKQNKIKQITKTNKIFYLISFKLNSTNVILFEDYSYEIYNLIKLKNKDNFNKIYDLVQVKIQNDEINSIKDLENVINELSDDISLLGIDSSYVQGESS